MQFEKRILINAPVDRLFSLYADVSDSSSWDPDVKFSSIDGQFSSGATGTLQPSSGPKTKITFTEVLHNRLFTVESKLPLCTMRFEHELSPVGNQIQALYIESLSLVFFRHYLVGSSALKSKRACPALLMG